MHAAGIICDALWDPGKGDGIFNGPFSIATEQ